MDLYRIEVTKAPTEAELGPYLSLLPWQGDTEKYSAVCSPVSVALDRNNPPHFAYTRVSSDEQGKKENSHIYQREKIAALAVEEGFDPSMLIWSFDTGKKRSDPPEKRPGLQKILTNLQKNSRVFLYNRDRLGAGLLAGHVSYLIRQAGGLVVSAEGFNGDNVGDDVYRAIKDALSQEELRSISRRVTATVQSRRRKQQTYCRRLYGFRKVSLLDGREVRSIKYERKRADEDFILEPIPEEQAVIAFIKSQRDEHGLSWESIANQLNANNVPPPDPRNENSVWHHTSTASVYRAHKKLNTPSKEKA